MEGALNPIPFRELTLMGHGPWADRAHPYEGCPSGDDSACDSAAAAASDSDVPLAPAGGGVRDGGGGMVSGVSPLAPSAASAPGLMSM